MATDLKPEKTEVVVGILGLQVVLAKQDNSWIAQGIEIDYAAAGTSIEDVKKRFQDGLSDTIQEHLNRFGKLDHLIGSGASADIWFGLLKSQQQTHEFSSVSVHRFTPPLDVEDFPYGSIRYLVPQVDDGPAPDGA